MHYCYFLDIWKKIFKVEYIRIIFLIDLSYLNLDWKPVPVISKFVDIVVNGMSQKTYDIKAYAQDPESVKNRTAYAKSVLRDMYSQDLLNKAKQLTGFDFSASLIIDPYRL